MKKLILIGFCVCGLGIQEAISQSVITQSKNLSYVGDLNTIKISGDYYITKISKIDSIINFGKNFLNKPYRYKGPSSWAMDCSGYIAFIFAGFGYQIPHSSISLGSIVENINETEIKKGDLLFFKGRNIKSNSIGHVSLVIETTNGSIKMMHSCHRGIVIDEYQKTNYYKQRFIKAGRLPFIFETKLFDTLNTVKDAPIPIRNFSNKFDSISIIGVGDMMLGTNFPSKSYLPPDDGINILTPVKHIIDKADIAFGNLEGVILLEGGTVKTCSNPDVCYAFRMPNHYVNYFKEAGFDILSIANNHVGDFGEEGRENTVKLIAEAEIKFAGLTKYPYTTFEKNGIKYGFCAFAPNEGTININDSKNAVTIVQHLDSICDIVIVSFHGGAEGSSRSHITRSDEIFLGENRGNPYKFARTVIDAGADVVFGHGPHVTRAIDIYKGRFITYSMGNFATYGRFNLKGLCGIAPIIKLFVNKKGEFLSGNIYSIKQIGEGGPIIDNDQMALKEIINLTQSDIPESPIIIKPNGLIYKK
jgi:poly-gamma-glutamate capsule biosynthesis protein CapA/YwtB (metallophosphatase superfamily)